jgi:hypothetical protein
MKRLGWVALFALVLPTYAMAQQGYTIQTPGQFPTNVNPNGVGGYTAQTPGQLPTYVQPNGPVRPCVGFNCR